MSHNWVFINSPHYRRFIERSRESRLVFWAAAAGLCGAAYLAAGVTMQLTNPDLDEEHSKDHSDQISKLPMHAQVGHRCLECVECVDVHAAAAVEAAWLSLSTSAATSRVGTHTIAPAVRSSDPSSPPQVAARRNREVLKAMITDVTTGKDQARYKSMLE
jgi:hypothetical protein